MMQATYELNDDNRSREINPLVAAAARLHCDELLVLTWEQEGAISEKGRKIRLLPLWKWLLGW